jgi:hypothetical protein
MKEQIPTDWKPLSTPYTAAQFASDIAKLKLCVATLSFGGPDC